MHKLLKNQREYVITSLFIAMQFAYTVAILISTKGAISYPGFYKVNEILHYKTQVYQGTALLLLATIFVAFIQYGLTWFGVKYHGYIAALSVSVGTLIYAGFLVQVLYAEGGSLVKAMLYSVLGLLAMVASFYYLRSSNNNIRRYAHMAVIVLLTISIFLLLFSKGKNGAKIWLTVGGFSVQTGEFLKVALALMAAASYEFKEVKRYKKQFYLVSLISIVVLVAARDIGNACIVFFIVLVAIYFLFSDFVKIALGGTFAGGLLFAAMFLFNRDSYAVKRLTSVFTVLKSGQGQHFESLLGIVSGGATGTGIKHSVVCTHVFASGTDFAFNVGAGVYGVGFLIMVMAAFAMLLLVVCIYSSPVAVNYMYIVLGETILFAQAFIHIGGNLNVLPFTGVTLPFISLGGSATLCAYLAVGMMLAGIMSSLEK